MNAYLHRMFAATLCAGVLVGALFGQTACVSLDGSMRAEYATALVSVQRSALTRETYGAGENTRSGDGKLFIYSDGLFSGVFSVSGARINVEIRNNTAQSIKLDWDGAAFIDIDGTSGRVSHSGVKYSEIGSVQPPSVIPAGASLHDSVVPANRISYRKGTHNRYGSYPGGWSESALIQPGGGFDDTFKAEAAMNTGKRFALILPLEAGGTRHEYTLWFEIQGVGFAPFRY